MTVVLDEDLYHSLFLDNNYRHLESLGSTIEAGCIANLISWRSRGLVNTEGFRSLTKLINAPTKHINHLMIECNRLAIIGSWCSCNSSTIIPNIWLILNLPCIHKIYIILYHYNVNSHFCFYFCKWVQMIKQGFIQTLMLGDLPPQC